VISDRKFFKLLNRKKVYYPLVVLFLILAQSLVFVAGSFQNETVVEETSSYVANVAKNETVSGRYASLIVEPKDGVSKSMRDPGSELYDLYGVFTERVATYSSFVNADHKYKIHFDDFDQDKNLSVIYVRAGFNTSNKKSKDGNFLHEYFHLEVMFERKYYGNTEPHWMYISKSQADKLLDLENKEHTTENYRSLLNTKTKMVMGDNEPVEWEIKNIYLEQNYFYDAVKECAGEFIFGTTGYPDEFKMQAMYFMSDYVFRNKFFIEYATSYYPTTDFDYSIGKYNLKEDAKIDSSKLVYEVNKKESVICALLITLSIILLIFSIIIVALTDYSLKLYNFAIFAFAALLPFIVFKIINLLSGSITLFSFFSNRVNMITLLVAFVSLIIIFYFHYLYAKKGKKQNNE